MSHNLAAAGVGVIANGAPHSTLNVSERVGIEKAFSLEALAQLLRTWRRVSG